MYKIEDIVNRVKIHRNGPKYFTVPSKGSFLSGKTFKNINYVPKSFSEIPVLGFDSTSESAPNLDLDTLETLITPPNETYSDILSPEAAELASQVDGIATQQFVKQFYEVYMAPLGLKEVYNRLGSIAGNIDNLHLLYPNGLKGLIAGDATASWRADINYTVEVDEDLYDSSGQKVTPFKYTSFGFPPFISHETMDASSLLTSVESGDTESEALQSTVFDMNNILYKRGRATARFPAFKQVNDNIHTLQVLLERCFGVVSTYINEWDLSMYMQEGLCSFVEKKDVKGEIVRLPQFVTTLTYGLLDDAPVEPLLNGRKDIVDLDQVAPYASLNLAVSTRYAIDNQPLGQKANQTNYIIADYPYSAYWYPSDSGVNYPEMNMSYFVRDLFSYVDNGLTFNEAKPAGHQYTPAVFHGKDLTKSSKKLLEVLDYTDCRNAVLSGWNATDSNGEQYLSSSDRTNQSIRSNAFSYLPFWKQFYTSGDDGMTDVDLYLQEVIASGKPCSFLNAGYQIINMIAGSNSVFQDFCEARNKEAYNIPDPQTEEDGEAKQNANMVIPSKYGDSGSSYKDMSFSLFKCKLKIPGSKLLNMFLNKDKSTSKAMSMADSSSSDIGLGGTDSSGKKNTGAASSGLGNATPTKTLGEPQITLNENGEEVEVTEYQPEANDELCSKKVVGDGVAEFSPFLYGGPHGKYYSPLTLEGYCQVGNQLLANVPTVDSYNVFEGIQSDTSVRGFEFSKNWKNGGSYIDTVMCLTPNEREALTKGSSEFGVNGMGPNTAHWMPYTSNWFVREYFRDWSKYITIRIFRHKIKIPHFWYFKLFRTLNGWLRNGIFFTKDYGTGTYGTRHHTGRVEYDVSAAEDWMSQDFKLLPTCGWNGGAFNTGTTWDYETTKQHIEHDAARFREAARWTQDEAGNVVWIWRPQTMHITADCVKWLIVPNNVGGGPQCGVLDETESSDRRWLHWSPYSAPGTKWFTQLKRLWYAGTRELSVTLPIKNTHGKILEIICGVANIYKSRSLAWGWRLKVRSYLTYRHGWHCPHPRWRSYWRWCYVRVYQETYNMYFRPNKVQWILPTDVLLNREAKYSTDLRNKKSSDIIDRWLVGGTDDKNTFTGINRGNGPILFPFTLEFMNKYGYYQPKTMIPGVSATQHTRYMKDMKVLHTKGMYFQNIMEKYQKKGYVEVVTGVVPYIQTWPERIYYTDEAAGVRYSSGWLGTLFRFFFGKIYEQSSRFTVARDVTNYADYPIWIPSRYDVDHNLTKIIDRCQGWPTVQEFQKSFTPYMAWYQPTDTMGVYIDTATQQIAWLKQLKQYASTFLTDKLIFEVYRKSVDNVVQGVIEANKNGRDYITDSDGWTDSYTEDINYHDALAIVRDVFETESDTRNTLVSLIDTRIEEIKALRAAAESYKKNFYTDPVQYMHLFMYLVSNTPSVLNNATTGGQVANDVVIQNGQVQDGILFEVNYGTTYNLYKNPGAVLWAYINVLYHVRKYWVNLRLNKRAGSYWQLRGLERVLTFMLAAEEGEDSPNSPTRSIAQGVPETLKTKTINYVQPRTAFSSQVTDEMSTVYTQAVYIKVDYTKLPNPMLSPKWDEASQKLDNQEICWVAETYKYAYKPQDGLYYIMSDTITNNISQYIQGLKAVVSEIYAKTYVITEDDFKDVITTLNSDTTTRSQVTTIKTYVKYDRALSTITGPTTAVNEAITLFINTLLANKQNEYIEAIRSQLYPVYIKFQPDQVWTGLYEGDSTGGWHIDEYQRTETYNVDREREDMYGIVHTNSEAISAGITFDVVAGLNPTTLLSSPTGLRNSSLLEILCSCVTREDLWRIEIPKDLCIPVTALEKKPRLVPAYQIDVSVNGLTAKKIEPTQKSVLVGAATSTILPILETSEDLLTFNSLAAIGQYDLISTPV